MSRDRDRQPGYLLLEDGSRFEGSLLGEAVSATGEVVFSTAMTGYQEAVTDPSYAGQILAFTYPMIGNYGASAKAMESDRAHVRAAVMREARNGTDAAGAESGWLDWLAEQGVTAISGIDTRALVRHLRARGSMRGGVFAGSLDEADAIARVEAEPPMAGADLARRVGPTEPLELEPLPASSGPRAGRAPHVVALDTGIKRSILEQFRRRGARLTLLPCASPAAEVAAREPDLVFLANGPGDPAALEYVVATVGELIGTRPVVGICLGHQLLCRAVGLDTYKLRFGHHGSNHPVKDLATGGVEITSQNHGFAVAAPDGSERIDRAGEVSWQTPFGPARLSHYNLYDGTVEGLTLPEARATTVQYHPEAGPGPRDSRHLFDRFLEMAGGA